MDETLLHEVFGVSTSYRSTGTQVDSGVVEVGLEPREKLFVCPQCRSREVNRRGQRSRRLQGVPIGLHPVFFRVQVPRCQCRACGAVFEIAPPFARPTRALRTRSRVSSTN